MLLDRIHLLATGGTIAGTAASPAQTTGYAAATLPVDLLCSAVPGLSDVAHLSTEQVAAIDSKDADPAFWQRLAGAAQAALDDHHVDGIVITHGTDTLEETAFYLHLVLKSAKPVVMVGAMRPATSLSADGPLNLLNAVRVAAAHDAAGRGVLVVMNQTIFGARDVAKTNCVRADAFAAPDTGPMGLVLDARVVWLARPQRAHGPATPFDAQTPLAPVDVLVAYAGMPARMVEAVVQGGARGVVLAGAGNGSVSVAMHAALREARQAGVAVVRASRTGSGYVMPGGGCDDVADGFCTADTLSPYKARILAMLALGAGCRLEDLQGVFETF
jgi:L-asparaginase